MSPLLNTLEAVKLHQKQQGKDTLIKCSLLGAGLCFTAFGENNEDALRAMIYTINNYLNHYESL